MTSDGLRDGVYIRKLDGELLDRKLQRKGFDLSAALEDLYGQSRIFRARDLLSSVSI